MAADSENPAAPPILSVTQLTQQIKAVLDGSFPFVWVSGEISNFKRHQSGHCYLTLKDEGAQIRAVIWRTTALRTRCELHDGLHVVCRGYLDVYARQGNYSLVVQRIEPR